MHEVPAEDWEEMSLADLGEYVNGYAFKPKDWSEHGLPIVRIAQITGSSEDCDHFAGTLSNTFRINDGDLIFSWSGTLAVVRWWGGPAWLNQHLFRVDPAAGIDDGFLFHVLSASVAEMDKRTHGSTMKHIKRGELREYRIYVPQTLREQKKIAHILDTLDTPICQTEALIAKLEQIKQGLLTDLLTRGIDENGQLRPPPDQAPELYKDSPLGRIPREWEVTVAGALLDAVDAGWSPSCPDEPPQEGEWGVLKVSAVSTGVYEPGESKRLPEGLRPIKALEVMPHDVLITRANGVADLVGRCVLVEHTPSSLMLSDKTLRLRPSREEITPYFLATLMSSQYVRRQLAGLMSGSSGQKNISQAQIRALRVAVAPLNEQDRVQQKVAACEMRLRGERQDLAKLRQAKTGLMDDLLTGRTRVTQLINASQQAVG